VNRARLHECSVCWQCQFPLFPLSLDVGLVQVYLLVVLRWGSRGLGSLLDDEGAGSGLLAGHDRGPAGHHHGGVRGLGRLDVADAAPASLVLLVLGDEAQQADNLQGGENGWRTSLNFITHAYAT